MSSQICIFLPDFSAHMSICQIKRKQCLVKKEIDAIITQDDMKNAPKTDQAQIVVTTRLHTSSFKQGQLMNP
ncbi:unnamed protein product [Lactuca virosa]|uniref:Uncharacterized protein n=1 Tax=Lactuca virosa TaxID=75947 RepID=A0AAU9NDY2_9ASTR|nr:unnamed protein product [Lactuca virosa]